MQLNRLINHQTKTVGMAAIILAVSAFLSRFLGVVRDWLLAKNFGASADLDIYFAAFKIPDFVYTVLILGGISVAFLPLFSEYFSRNKKEAWDFVSNSLNIFLVLLIFLSFLLFVFTPSLVKLIAPGFSDLQMEKTVLLTRIMFLSPIFFGLSSIFSGVLQYFNRFLIYSLCPILYNLGIIFGILFLVPRFGILGVGLGVILGSFLHLIIQLPSAFNSGFKYQPIFNFKDSKIKKVFLLMLPRTLGISAQQISVLFFNAIASTLAIGSISIFNFANNIQYFPIGVVGVSFAIASFPALSKSWVENGESEFAQKFSLVFRQIFYLIIPISILLFVLREQVVAIILRHGEFSDMAAKLTGASLGLFCLGIFASSLIPLLFRAFFSFKDTKTPTFIAIASMGFSIFLSFFLTKILSAPSQYWLGIEFQRFLKNTFSLGGSENISVLGLPLAISLAAIFQFILLVFFLKRRIPSFNLRKILSSFSKILLAATLMAVIIYFLFCFAKPYFYAQTFWRAFGQIILVSSVGFAIYLLATFVLGSPESKNIGKFLQKKIS